MGDVTDFPADRARPSQAALDRAAIDDLDRMAVRLSDCGDLRSGYAYLVHLLGQAMSAAFGADQASHALELEAALLVGRDPGKPEPAA